MRRERISRARRLGSSIAVDFFALRTPASKKNLLLDELLLQLIENTTEETRNPRIETGIRASLKSRMENALDNLI